MFGAAEGVSFLVVFGVVGWSLYSKVKTGSGLPAGPSGEEEEEEEREDLVANLAHNATHCDLPIIKKLLSIL